MYPHTLTLSTHTHTHNSTGTDGVPLRARGVAYVRDNHKFEATATKEVILCAGAIGTAKLLQVSGIGPRDVLERAGIKVRCESPAVGRTLRTHVCVPVGFNSGTEDTLDAEDTFVNRTKFATVRVGPLTSPMYEAGSFFRSAKAEPVPDVGVFFVPGWHLGVAGGPCAAAMTAGGGAQQNGSGSGSGSISGSVSGSGGSGSGGGDPKPTPHGFTLLAALTRCDAVGTVEAVSADPYDPPKIAANLLGLDNQAGPGDDAPDAAAGPHRHTRGDMARLVTCLKTARHIAEGFALAGVRGEELVPGAGVESDADIQRYIAAHAAPMGHAYGSCPMGPCVSPAFEVIGTSGLRVADASIVPVCLSAVSAAPAVMIAERAADWIINGRYTLRPEPPQAVPGVGCGKIEVGSGKIDIGGGGGGTSSPTAAQEGTAAGGGQQQPAASSQSQDQQNEQQSEQQRDGDAAHAAPAVVPSLDVGDDTNGGGSSEPATLPDEV
jgi:choline dehydrogenase